MFKPPEPPALSAPPPLPVTQAPQGSKPAKKPAAPSFLGTMATPLPQTSGGATGKTLLGQ